MKATNMSKPIGVGIDPLAPGREPLILGAASPASAARLRHGSEENVVRNAPAVRLCRE